MAAGPPGRSIVVAQVLAGPRFHVGIAFAVAQILCLSTTEGTVMAVRKSFYPVTLKSSAMVGAVCGDFTVTSFELIVLCRYNSGEWRIF